MVRRRFLIGALMLALFVVGWWVGRGTSSDLYANLDLFVEVLHKVEDNYVDPVKPEKEMRGAIDGMLKQLDPYSQYLDAQDLGNLKGITEGRFSGIGIVVGVRDGWPTVISPIEGGPAWQAGLHSGDVIVRIDGRSSSGLSVEDAARLLRGKEGTSVVLSVKPEGEEDEHDYTLTRREVVTKSVPYAFLPEPGLGYVRLASFSETSGEEVRKAVDELRKQGAKRFILDLRLNPGGLLDQAVDVAGQFLDKGALVVYTRGRVRGQDQRYYATRAGGDTRSPLVVLVDEGSASASEIVAGALQDLDRALIVGSTSFGKGRVQNVFPLRGQNAALKLTTALYYTPSGRSIDHRHPALEDDEGDDEDAAPDSAADSLAARPRFRTSAGRTVYGGGGITPDVPVKQDSLPVAVREIERRGLPFRFANRWINAHPTTVIPATIPDPTWNEFTTFVAAEGVKADAAELQRERPVVERSLRRELARRIGGDGAAMRVVLETDPVFARARAALERAAVPKDVFAATVRDHSRDAAR